MDPMMNGGGPPAMEGAAGAAMDAEKRRGAANKSALGAAAPSPTGNGYKVAKLNTMVGAFNDVIKKFGPDLPEIPDMFVDPEGKPLKTWDQPLPEELFSALYVTDQAVQQVASATDGLKPEKYALGLDGLVDDGGVMNTTSRLKMIAGDKKLLKAMVPGPVEDKPMPPDADGGEPYMPSDEDMNAVM